MSEEPERRLCADCRWVDKRLDRNQPTWWRCGRPISDDERLPEDGEPDLVAGRQPEPGLPFCQTERRERSAFHVTKVPCGTQGRFWEERPAASDVSLSKPSPANMAWLRELFG